MGRQKYPNFLRAQRERGPYFRAPHSSKKKPLSMLPLVALGAVATVAAFNGNLRSIGREREPQAGDYFRNCDAARAVGTAPLYAGEPGYRTPLDRDDDGVACEPYRGI